MDVPGRILAIDPGSKRIGYAVSDDLQMTARPLEVWKKKGLEHDLDYLGQLIKKHEAVEVLVGLPYRLDGSESPSTERAKAFVEAIRERWPDLQIRTRDEALTTWEAEQRMQLEGIPQTARKSKIDAYAAAALLEEELNYRG